MRIFLAEDNEDNYLVVKSNLKKIDKEIELIWAHNGQIAIDMLQSENGHIDIFLIDIEMPCIDGTAVAKWIRTQPKFDTVPIIALTASVFAEMKKMYLEKGFDYILEKPFERKDFIEMINKSLS